LVLDRSWKIELGLKKENLYFKGEDYDVIGIYKK
jgi:hypothetical protein